MNWKSKQSRKLYQIAVAFVALVVFVGASIPVCICRCACDCECAVTDTGCCGAGRLQHGCSQSCCNPSNMASCCCSIAKKTAASGNCCGQSATECCNANNCECSCCCYCNCSLDDVFLPPSEPQLDHIKFHSQPYGIHDVYSLRPTRLHHIVSPPILLTSLRLHAILSVWLN